MPVTRVTLTLIDVLRRVCMQVGMISVPNVHVGSPASPYVSLVGATPHQPGDLSDLETRLMGLSLVHAPSNGSSCGSSVCSNGIQEMPVCQLCHREGHHVKDCPLVTS